MTWNGSGSFSPVLDFSVRESNGDPDDILTGLQLDNEFDNISTGLENCVTRDGQNAASADLPMATYKHTNVGNAAARNQYGAVGQIQDSSFVYATSGGSANAYTLTLSPAITAYIAGQCFRFLSNFANTGSATLNVNGVGAKTLKTIAGNALQSGMIPNASVVEVVYNGTDFILIGCIDSISGATLQTATVATGDLVLIQDADDSSNLKAVTAQSIANLASTTPGAFAAYASANYSHTGALHKMVLNTEIFDADSDFDNATNYRWTPSTAGKYKVTAQGAMNDLADGAYYKVLIYKNGSPVYQAWQHAADAGLSPVSCLAECVLDMNGTTDYIEIYTSHTGTNPTTELGGSLYNCVSAVRLA